MQSFDFFSEQAVEQTTDLSVIWDAKMGELWFVLCDFLGSDWIAFV